MAIFNKYNAIPPSLSQPAKTWIEEEGLNVHEALAIPSRFDYQRAEFTPRQPRRDLSAAIGRYVEKAGKEALFDYNSKDKWTWNDVLEEADEAVQAYIAAGEGSKGAMRKVFRRAGDMTDTINPWLEIIPQDQYFSMLSAGLKLIFAAAKVMSEKRKQIIEALQDMPKTMELASKMLKTYGSDKHLANLVTELEYSLLDAIDCMISWLLEKPRKKIMKSFLQGPQYGAIVDEQLQLVGKRVAALRNGADDISLERKTKAEGSIRRIEPQITLIRQIITDQTVQSRKTEDAISNSHKILSDIWHGVESQNALFRTFTEEILKRSRWSRIIEERTIKSQSAAIQYPIAVAALGQQLECYATRPQLLEELMVDLSTAAKDIQYVLSQGQMADTAPEANCLFRTPRFQRWLLGGMSDFMFVDGDAESHALEKVSPLTVLCAMLSLSLHNMPKAMSIYFYCGLHSGSYSSLSGLSGLLRSLIAQLLLTQEISDFRFIYSAEYFNELRDYNISYLWDTFQHLLWQQPDDKVLFCIIDNITFLEEGEVSFLLTKLGAIAKSTSPDQPVLKILITNACCTSLLRELVRPQHYLELSEAMYFDLLPKYGLIEQLSRLLEVWIGLGAVDYGNNGGLNEMLDLILMNMPHEDELKTIIPGLR